MIFKAKTYISTISFEIPKKIIQFLQLFHNLEINYLSFCNFLSKFSIQELLGKPQFLFELSQLGHPLTPTHRSKHFTNHLRYFAGDSQEECLGCGKTFLTFSSPLNDRNFCRDCLNERSPQNNNEFPGKKFSYADSASEEESYTTEIDEHEEIHAEK